ncbi:class I SAM-dependent methyltransferase [Streptomyces sp. NK08204]|uniref:class I SAM-dependent methyltransferase n=1 Tax=Streptomyces sp. NK08204 TaxID=2873260 RepID=UPI001CEDEA2A|nr:class I SAM-dependent methyltransferase [Streptomyces sp. NK08204]
MTFLDPTDDQAEVPDDQLDPAAVSRQLADHPAVDRAVALLRPFPDGRDGLAAYVVPDPGFVAEQAPDLVSEHVAGWKDVFEHVYGEVKDGTPDDRAFDRSGWNSSYTGTVMTRAEVGEAIDSIVDQVAALPHRRVLEVGCGTGMLLFRIAPDTERYWATDLSGEVLRTIQHELDASPERYAHVTLLEREGTDFTGFADDSIDLVLLNSVIQYFPSADYLRQVLREAVRVVRPGGAVFIGDVRDLRLLEVLHSSVEVFHADGDARVDEVRRRVRAAVDEEGELLVDPSFFAALVTELTGVSEAGLQLKRGTVANELTKFRYDVTLRVGAEPVTRPYPPAVQWNPADWGTAAVDVRLGRGEPRDLLILDVPDSRTAADVATWRALTEAAAEARLDDLPARDDLDGETPGDWWAIGRRHGLTVAVTPPRSGAIGRYDVVLSRSGAIPAWVPQTRRQALSNAPFRHELSDDLARELRDFLHERLPEHMVPAHIAILDEIPLSPDGTLDVRRLPDPISHAVGSGVEHLPPRSTT